MTMPPLTQSDGGVVDELCLEIEEAGQVLALRRGDCQSDDVLHNLVHHLDGVESRITQQLESSLDQAVQM